METRPIAAIEILGVRVHNVTMGAALERLTEYLRAGGQHIVVTVNPEFIMAAQRNESFRDVLNRADLALPDGVGLLFASRLSGAALTGRVTGADLTSRLLQKAAERGLRVFFFGADDGVAAKAAQAVAQKFPGAQIVGAENERDESGRVRSDDETVSRIRHARPDILLVAFGAPKQELWIAEHLKKVPSVKIAIGVGGTLDFYAGRLRRAPSFFRKTGLEWLWRLALQPARWRRIVTATIRFPWAVLTTPRSVRILSSS